ncbi:MAG: hypothetical protein HQL44_10235 [Alphaproteobacteria bacterium]|nr:hypothetical protein [Alphaproteobacteria bacterium]
MNWVAHILSSEFVWGVVLGLLLSVVVAMVSSWLETRSRRKNVAFLCQNLIGSVCDLIQNLEDNRDRNRRIEHEFLETITAEVIVYGRNREYLVALPDETLRKDVRVFFTRVAAQLAQVNGFLNRFYEADRALKSEMDSGRKQQHEQAAIAFLNDAHKACDRLRELLAKRESITARLNQASRGIL